MIETDVEEAAVQEFGDGLRGSMVRPGDEGDTHFEARRHLKASFPGTILREGMLLHAA